MKTSLILAAFVALVAAQTKGTAKGKGTGSLGSFGSAKGSTGGGV
jgi:hypothetical protein